MPDDEAALAARRSALLVLAYVAAARPDACASRLPQALRAHLHDHDATRRLVAEVSGSLQRRVEADAASVVARLASKEVAERQLSAALERRCMQRVDERMGSLWTAYFLGGAVTAAGRGLLGLVHLRPPSPGQQVSRLQVLERAGVRRIIKRLLDLGSLRRWRRGPSTAGARVSAIAHQRSAVQQQRQQQSSTTKTMQQQQCNIMQCMQ